jgi:Sigma-70 region 2
VFKKSRFYCRLQLNRRPDHFLVESTQSACRFADDRGDSLYKYARLRRAEVAEDLVQEAFCVAVHTYSNFRGKSSERSWLCGI